MKLLLLNVLLLVLFTAPCQGLEESSDAFVCPDTSETSLVSAVISGCKVHYICVRGVVSKLFHCSESQLLEGTTHVCQENPQCPGLQTVTESENLPSNIDVSTDSKIDFVPESTLDAFKNLNKTHMGPIMRFIMCILEVQSYGEFCKTCIEANLVHMIPFNEMDLSTRVFEVYSKMLNKTSEDQEYDPSWRLAFRELLTEINKVVCKDLSKQPGASGTHEEKTDISPEDPKLFSESESDPNKKLSGERSRRSTFTRYGLLTEILVSVISQMDIPQSQRNKPVIPTGEPLTTTPAVTTVSNSDLKDNRSLMSNVIVPIIQDIVNDEEALQNVTNMVRSVFEAVVPLATEILKASNDSFNPDQKDILKIPVHLVLGAIHKIYTEAYPILRSIMRSKLQSVLMLLSKNSRLLFRSWDQMEARLEPNMKELVSRGRELYRKYYRMFRTSTREFVHTYSLMEIQQDIESMYSLLPEQSKNLLLKNWNVFQDESGISTISIANFLLDIPGMFEALEAIPLERYVYLFFTYF